MVTIPAPVSSTGKKQDLVQVWHEGRWIEAEREQVEPILVQRMQIPPDWAAEVLANRNQINRPQKLAQQEKFVHYLQSGRFYTTNQGIGFLSNGQLADGQNRLAAIVTSGIPATMIVKFGMSMDELAAIDDGVKRSDHDIICLMGDRETPKRAIMIANTMMALVGGLMVGHGRSDKYEKQAFYKRYMEGLLWTNNQFTPVKRRGITQMSVLAAVCRAYYNVRNNPTKLDRLIQFIKILDDGMVVNPEKDSAVIKLRNMLLDDRNGGLGRSRMPTGYNRSEVFGKSERAIHLFLDGQPCDRLYEAKTELFPLPGEEELKLNK